MCNVIFSAGNYPSPGGSDVLCVGNGLYVDDVEMVYSSRVDKVLVNGKEFAGFNPDNSGVQIVKLSEIGATGSEIKIEALRGVGTIATPQGKKANFKGRKLDTKEMTVTPGALNGAPWTITVKAEDGSSTHTYKLQIKNYFLKYLPTTGSPESGKSCRVITMRYKAMRSVPIPIIIHILSDVCSRMA